MEISVRGRGARAGRNNNLLTSHARNAMRYLASTHASALPLSLSPFRTPARPRTDLARQPIVSTAIVIYRLDDLRFRLHRRQRQLRYQDRPGTSWSFGAIHQRAIARISSLATARRIVLPLTVSPYSHLISHHANLGPPLLNCPCRNYQDCPFQEIKVSSW